MPANQLENCCHTVPPQKFKRGENKPKGGGYSTLVYGHKSLLGRSQAGPGTSNSEPRLEEEHDSPPASASAPTHPPRARPAPAQPGAASVGTFLRRNLCAAAGGAGAEGAAGRDRRWGAMAAGRPWGERGSAVLELPRTPRMVCVEYPGLVRDVGAMLLTLGGEQGVSRVRGAPGDGGGFPGRAVVGRGAQPRPWGGGWRHGVGRGVSGPGSTLSCGSPPSGTLGPSRPHAGPTPGFGVTPLAWAAAVHGRWDGRCGEGWQRLRFPLMCCGCWRDSYP